MSFITIHLAYVVLTARHKQVRFDIKTKFLRLSQSNSQTTFHSDIDHFCQAFDFYNLWNMLPKIGQNYTALSAAVRNMFIRDWHCTSGPGG